MPGHAYRGVKRAIDVVASLSLLFVLGPLLALVSLLILVTMGRPILFRQVRPGRNGEPFTLVKFRTMRTGGGSDADRLTRLGQLLRSTSIDELPELWNVLRGDMSLVGPRPLLMEYLPLYDKRQATRHAVKPGVTGLAQVNGRNELDWTDRLEMDATYVEQQSLVIDLRILGKTVIQVGQRNGISAEGEATMPLFTGVGASSQRQSADAATSTANDGGQS